MAQTVNRTDLAYLDSTALPVVAEIAVFVAVTVAKWSERRRTRNSLKGLDDHLLRDIGVTPHQARREAARPFWLS